MDLNPPVKATAVSEPDRSPSVEPTEPPANTFPQSVASGDPSSEGAILWTRIAPEAHRKTASLFVDVAESESFTKNVRRAAVSPEGITPTHDYTIKIDLDESELTLEPDRRYFYRFEYDGATSQTGRFRTLPTQDATPERVRFAVVNCQNYLNGYFGAYSHIADEDVDFILDLGDFIYEYATQREGRHTYPDRDIELPSGNDVATCLEDYRYLYRTYHEDPFLRAALEQHARIFTWDDHEFANDIYWDYDRNAPGAPEHPLDGDQERMRDLVGDALTAWWEYTPTRARFNHDATSVNEWLQINRSFRIGDLLTLVVTDQRLFKTQPSANCADTRLPDRLEELLPDWLPFCYVNRDPADTMLGEKQREWFLDEVCDSETTWTAWANEVLTLPVRVGIGPFSLDPSDQAWDGYESEREQLMYRIKYGGVENFVTLTGDMHSYLVGYQRLDYPSRVQSLLTVPHTRTERSRRVGVELMTPAMTSVNIAEKFGENLVNRVPKKYARRFPRAVEAGKEVYGHAMEALFSAGVRFFMPHVEAFASHEWGYSVVEFSREECRHWTYGVDKTVNSSDAEKRLINAVRIPVQRSERPLEIRDVGEYPE